MVGASVFNDTEADEEHNNNKTGKLKYDENLKIWKFKIKKKYPDIFITVFDKCCGDNKSGFYKIYIWLYRIRLYSMLKINLF